MPDQSAVSSKITVSASRNRFRKFLYVVISAAAGFLLIALVLGGLLLDKPAVYPLPRPGPDTFSVNMGVLHRIMVEISVANPGNRATLVLTPKEVDQLLASLRMLHGGMEKQVKAPPATSYDVHFRDGLLFFSHSLPRNGLTLNIYAELIPEFRDGRLGANVKICRVGRLRLPDWFIAGRLRWANAMLRNFPEYQLLTEILISLSVLPDGRVEIVYSPAGIMEKLSDEIPLGGTVSLRKR